MREELLYHYSQELTYLRYMGAEFAAKYPKVAGRLMLEAGKCEDPHVERLLEGFAFLAARIHTKIDDEFPEVIESLLDVLYPYYLRPIPSASIVQFHLDPAQGKLMTGLSVPRGSTLFSAPVAGAPCKFQTVYDTTLWPIEVKAADWRSADRLQPPAPSTGATAVIRLELHCFQDVNFSKLDLKTLRLFLNGDGSVVNGLVELLCNNCIQIRARDLAAPAKKSVVFAPGSLRQVGFNVDEGLFQFPRRTFWGYRLLEEYFAFPEKFYFLDLSGFEQLAAEGFGDKIELLFFLSEFERTDRRQSLELGVSKSAFRLGCAPAVNLFPQVAEPILVEQKKFEYRIVADARREEALDIFSIDDVTGVMGGSSETVAYEPFFSHRHSSIEGPTKTFWHASRKVSSWRSSKSADLYITFVDLTGSHKTPDKDSVTLRLTCSNGELPSRLPFGSDAGDFQLGAGGPITRIVALTKPTEALQPPQGKGLLWRLISRLSLNYLSLVAEGGDAFREILRLHNFTGSAAAEKQIDGILGLRSEPHFARLTSSQGVSFARGTRVEIELDEEQFTGVGAYTFSAVMDVFLGLYTSMNSFSQLVVKTRQRKRVLKQWPPRAGRKILI
ncbi:MAG TPA: type VI secretion system baseplate subunit TssF [Bryobacteraceae bacterium]|nr:type VI secretion system baseplate subunit TssF [Bryobacteraceae bacterium]